MKNILTIIFTLFVLIGFGQRKLEFTGYKIGSVSREPYDTTEKVLQISNNISPIAMILGGCSDTTRIENNSIHFRCAPRPSAANTVKYLEQARKIDSLVRFGGWILSIGSKECIGCDERDQLKNKPKK